MLLKTGEYYWLNAPAISEQEPLCIGKCVTHRDTQSWHISGQIYTAGAGIDVIRHISKPRGY